MPPNGAAADEMMPVVDADDPVLEPLGDAQQARVVAREEVRGEAVDGVVGQPRSTSSSVSNGVMPATGPNVSSCEISISGVTSSSSVGA